MFELIDSNYTRNRFEEIGFQLNDWQKAALIWNKPNVTRQERISALMDLSLNTNDKDLKFQIEQRLVYEQEIMEQFKVTVFGKMIYVVFDEDEFACGYFGKYDTAIVYAENYIKKEKTRCTIEKYNVINSDTIPLVKPNCRLNPNIFTNVQEALVEYSGDAIARLYLNESANITQLWSNELGDKKNKEVDEYDKKRFEYQFLSLPYIHHEGLPIKYLPTGEYGVIETSMEKWNKFLDRVNKGLYADFSDTALTVYFLTEKGYWSHQHINPIYLEVEMPEMNLSDEKQIAFCRAIDAMSDYMDGHNDRFQEELVLRTTKEYASICESLSLAERKAKNAKSINDILS